MFQGVRVEILNELQVRFTRDAEWVLCTQLDGRNLESLEVACWRGVLKQARGDNPSHVAQSLGNLDMSSGVAPAGMLPSAYDWLCNQNMESVAMALSRAGVVTVEDLSLVDEEIMQECRFTTFQKKKFAKVRPSSSRGARSPAPTTTPAGEVTMVFRG